MVKFSEKQCYMISPLRKPINTENGLLAMEEKLIINEQNHVFRSKIVSDNVYLNDTSLFLPIHILNLTMM